MKIRCPFSTWFFESSDCPYLTNGFCNEIEINTGNSDAWCTEHIEKGFLVNKVRRKNKACIHCGKKLTEKGICPLGCTRSFLGDR